MQMQLWLFHLRYLEQVNNSSYCIHAARTELFLASSPAVVLLQASGGLFLHTLFVKLHFFFFF